MKERYANLSKEELIDEVIFLRDCVRELEDEKMLYDSARKSHENIWKMADNIATLPKPEITYVEACVRRATIRKLFPTLYKNMLTLN